MNRKQLVQQIFSKNSYLCIGLDTDPAKLPESLKGDPDGILVFNKEIIDATRDHCVAYKVNTAFYEAQGVKGWEIMAKTMDYIPTTHFKIADAKRGDIGNTSSYYAKAFFEEFHCDAITVAPYMGKDSLQPFLNFKDKWTIVLGLTSNPGARDFEMQRIITQTNSFVEAKELALDVASHKEEYLYETVLRKVSEWGSPENLMFVVGATRTGEFNNIRTLIPENFLLVPGVGTQGGDLKEISEQAFTRDCGLLVNVSRSIIYASNGDDFSDKAALSALEYQSEMREYLAQIKERPQ